MPIVCRPRPGQFRVLLVSAVALAASSAAFGQGTDKAAAGVAVFHAAALDACHAQGEQSGLALESVDWRE